MFNLTVAQKKLVKWLVKNVKERKLDEEFVVHWISTFDRPTCEAGFLNYGGTQDELDELQNVTPGSLDALVANDLLLCQVNYAISKSGSQSESNRKCTLTGKAYEAVNTDFNAPDTSFLKTLTPLADVNGFDEELKRRCLPILATGGSDPMLWDSAVRTAGVILEERLRNVGTISDPNRTGRNLVNDIFGNGGTLSSKFAVTSERDGYRELYAGIVGAFRNPSAHRLVDPSPEEGSAFIVFVNLLLKKLEALR